MTKRTSALSDIRNLVDWKVFNPIFELNAAEFDQAFSSDRNLPKGFYLEHKISSTAENTFEDNMCKNLFSGHGQTDSKLYVLRGGLGKGKTCFCKYMGRDKLPEVFGDTFFLYINCYGRFPENATCLSDFEDVFRREFKKCFICKDPSIRKSYQYDNDAKLAKAILYNRGDEDSSRNDNPKLTICDNQILTTLSHVHNSG